MRILALVLALGACDAQTTHGACGQPTLWTNSGEGGVTCDMTYAWTCGATEYNVTCSCPSEACTCFQSTGSNEMTTTVKNPGYCATCDTSTMIDVCGFPHR